MLNMSETLANTNKAMGQAILNIANTMFVGAEHMLALNLSCARTALEDGVTNIDALMRARGLDQLISLHVSLTQPTFKKALTYSSDLYEISSQNKSVFFKVIEGQLAEFNKNIATVLNKAAESSPESTDLALAAIKSAIGTASLTYENMAKSAHQAAERTETHVASAAKPKKAA